MSGEEEGWKWPDVSRKYCTVPGTAVWCTVYSTRYSSRVSSIDAPSLAVSPSLARSFGYLAPCCTLHVAPCDHGVDHQEASEEGAEEREAKDDEVKRAALRTGRLVE